MGEFLNALGLGPKPSPTAMAPVLPTGIGDDSAADAVVQGDPWKPKKRSALGFIADTVLSGLGGQPVFGLKIRDENIRDAMETFPTDPAQAIRRLNMLRGQQGNVAKLYDQYRDNKRADEAAETLAESRREKAYLRLGGMLRAIESAKDPTSEYEKNLPILRRYAEGRGLDVELGDKYDPSLVNNFIMGNVSPEDQIRMEQLSAYRDARLAQQNRGLDLREADTQSKIQRRNDQTAQGAERIQIARDKPSAKEERVIMSPGGRQVVVHPNGRVAVATDPDGTKHVLEKFGNGWKIRKPAEK